MAGDGGGDIGAAGVLGVVWVVAGILGGGSGDGWGRDDGVEVGGVGDGDAGGAYVGYLSFGVMADRLGRKPAFGCM
ncbi:MAG: hypothetical protein U0R19_29970 [Bryobacteraceae bacterium]